MNSKEKIAYSWQIGSKPKVYTSFVLYLKVFKTDLYLSLSRRCGGLMVSTLVSRSSSPGLSPGQGHCVVFLGKTLYSHGASLQPGVQMGTSELLGKPDNLRGSDLR